MYFGGQAREFLGGVAGDLIDMVNPLSDAQILEGPAECLGKGLGEIYYYEEPQDVSPYDLDGQPQFHPSFGAIAEP